MQACQRAHRRATLRYHRALPRVAPQPRWSADGTPVRCGVPVVAVSCRPAALIKRQQGQIQESLQLFQAATCLNPHNVCNLKQVGRSLYLLGKHKAAIDVYEEAQRIGIEDWEIWHNKGLCLMYLKHYDRSIECFRRANLIQRHDATFMQLGKVRVRVDRGGGCVLTRPRRAAQVVAAGAAHLQHATTCSRRGGSLTPASRLPRRVLALLRAGAHAARELQGGDRRVPRGAGVLAGEPRLVQWQRRRGSLPTRLWCASSRTCANDPPCVVRACRCRRRRRDPDDGGPAVPALG